MANESAFKKLLGIYTDKSINPYVRGLTWAGTLVLLYIAGKAIYVKVFPSQAQIAQKERQKQLEDDITNISQAQTPTYSTTQYNTDSSAIVAQFSGCDWTSGGAYAGLPILYSDSYFTVLNIINKYKNDLDVLLLQKAFGKRTISKSFACGGDYIDVDLEAAITNQLSGHEIAELNTLLESKGIKKVKF